MTRFNRLRSMADEKEAAARQVMAHPHQETYIATRLSYNKQSRSAPKFFNNSVASF